MYNNKFFGQKVAEGNRISMKINISLQKFNFHLNITWVFPLQSQYILLRRNICVLGSDGRGYEFQSGLGRPKNSISVGFSIDKKVKLKNICYAFLSYAGILIKNPTTIPLVMCVYFYMLTITYRSTQCRLLLQYAYHFFYFLVQQKQFIEVLTVQFSWNVCKRKKKNFILRYVSSKGNFYNVLFFSCAKQTKHLYPYLVNKFPAKTNHLFGLSFQSIWLDCKISM